jgi:hypothetical protein
MVDHVLTTSRRLWQQKAVINNAWRSLACSENGEIVIACQDSGGQLYTSDNYGTSWTVRIDDLKQWSCVAASSSGAKLAACGRGPEYIYTSDDYGVTWTMRTSAGKRWWWSVTMSSDGTKLAACHMDASNNEGYIWTSIDSGATWTQQMGAGFRKWSCISSSADGMTLIACEYSGTGNIYLSRDGGLTWAVQTGTPSGQWYVVSLSQDGSKLAGGLVNDFIWVSLDSGTTWYQRISSGTGVWRGLSLSGNGSFIIATDGNTGGLPRYSYDYGETWTYVVEIPATGYLGTTCSSNGIFMAVGAIVGYIYVSQLTEDIDPLSNSYLSTTVDVLGNVYVAYWNNADQSGRTYVGGTYDVVVTKMTTTNQVKWTRHQTSYNTTGYGWAPAIGSDVAGNIYVTFPTVGTFPGQVHSGGWDIVVYKLDTNGNTKWVRQQSLFNTDKNDMYPSIAVDPTGNVFIAYRTDGTVPGQVHSGGYDIVVFKLDTNGNFKWITQNSVFNTTYDDTDPSIVLDTSGNVYVAYSTQGGTAPGQVVSGSSDIVVFKLDANGTTLWVQQQPTFNTPGNNEIPVITVDTSQNVYVAYITDSTASGQVYTGGSSDIVVFKLDINGMCQWVVQQPSFNSSESDAYPSIGCDKNGNTYIAYCTAGVTSGQTLTGWTYDVVIFKMSTEGYTQWVQQQPMFNTTGENLNPCIKIDSQGSIYIAYPTDGSVAGVPTTGPYDIVVTKLLTAIESRPVIACDSENNIIYAYYTDQQKANNQNDMVITKKNSNGVTLWELKNSTINSPKSNQNPCIVAFGTDCYIVYQTSGELVPGESLFPFDIVVLKIDKSGNILWLRQDRSFNTTRSDELPSADVDDFGNLYVAYQTTGRIYGGYRTSLKDQYDIAYFKMSPNGDTIYARQSRVYNSYRGNETPCLRVDKYHNCFYIAFMCLGRILGQQFSGYSDIVLAKFNTYDGVVMPLGGGFWVIQQPTFNTTLYDVTPMICIDAVGYIYICYTSDGGYASGQSNIGMADIIICKLDSAGNVVKISQSPIFNTSKDELNPAITYHGGYIYVAYQTSGVVSGQVQTGQSDIVVMKLNSVTLGVVWIRQNPKFNTTADEAHPSIATDAYGSCYFAYETSGNFYGQQFGSSYRAAIVGKMTSTGVFSWVRK